MSKMISRIHEVQDYFILNKIRGKSYLNSSFTLTVYLLQRFFNAGSRTLNTGNVIDGYHLYNLPLLISYSRSGTNWIRYIIEYLSQQPTPGYQRSESGVNYFIDRAHAGYKNIGRYQKVILVIRNYKECLIRHHGADFVNSFASVAAYLETDKDFQRPDWYIKNIQAFDAFSGEKVVLYYEDLLIDSEAEVNKIAKFLGLENERTNDLICNISDHKQRSVAMYKNDHDSATAGDVGKLDYHSKQNLSEEDRLEFDAYYRDRYTALYNTYLVRYQE